MKKLLLASVLALGLASGSVYAQSKAATELEHQNKTVPKKDRAKTKSELELEHQNKKATSTEGVAGDSGDSNPVSSSTTTKIQSDYNNVTGTIKTLTLLPSEISDFVYSTQKEIEITLATHNEAINSKTQRQIFFYEERITVTEVYSGLLLKGIIYDGSFKKTITIGNHIKSIWIVIPAINYAQNVAISLLEII